MAHERGDVMSTSLERRPGAHASADELQQLLRAKRESITQTVEEIKMTMHSGFQDTKDKMHETLDWRHQVQHYPLAAVAGALAVGFLAGQLLGRAMGSERSTGMRRRSMTASSFGAGTSLAPASSVTTTARTESHRPHRERHFVPPAVKSKFMGRMEDVLMELSDNLMSEVSRVGRDIIVPSLVGSLTNAFQDRTRGMTGGSSSSTNRDYRSKSTTESASYGSSGSTAAGGPINSGEDQSPGNRFQGRGI